MMTEPLMLGPIVCVAAVALAYRRLPRNSFSRRLVVAGGAHSFGWWAVGGAGELAGFADPLWRNAMALLNLLATLVCLALLSVAFGSVWLDQYSRDRASHE